MENALILNHLPFHYSYHSGFAYFRNLLRPPSARELEDALVCMGLEKLKIIECMQTAIAAAEKTAGKLSKLQVGFTHYWDSHYPASLKEISNPPWGFYFLGKMPQVVPTLAIVGTRKPNSYGKELIEKYLSQIQTYPLQIISGLAYGTDTLAHLTANQYRIPNFAVLGSGVDQVYPRCNLDLADKIVSMGGGLLSEYPIGTTPFPSHFPFRNRIISALSHIVWVVQGTANSGTVHTANHALEQGKTLVACPGDVFSELMAVPHKLIYDGAQILIQPKDLDLLLEKNMI